MRALNIGYVLKDAERMSQSWNPSYLFIATLEGFYFDEINTVIDNKGDISKLDSSHISDELQKQYLQILVDFEKNN